MRKHLQHTWLIALLSTASLCAYAFFRIRYYLMVSGGLKEMSLAALLLASELFMLLHAIGYMIDTLRIRRKKRAYRFTKLEEGALPTVAVVVPARHEPREILEQTFITLRSLDYPAASVYLLDDSSDPAFIREAKRICHELDVHYFHPRTRHGAKAGILNEFLATMDEEYLAIFDADQHPLPDFLRKTVSIAQSSKRIAFVQTPQVYTNIDVSPIARGAALQQSVFYESLCEAKCCVNAMFCCGTNVLIRVSALRSVGGFDERFITEDFATSVKLHSLGYRSVYYNHARVFGMAPESLPAYFKQQARWAGGNASVLRSVFERLLSNPRSMTASQWWEYLLGGSYYFVSWAFLLLMLCPILYLLVGFPTYFMSPVIYLGTFVPYFVWTLGLFYGTMMRRHYKPMDVFTGVILNSISFPVITVATLLGLAGKRMTFSVTPKGAQRERTSILRLWPWIVMIALNVFAIAVGLTKLSVAPYAIIVNIIWCGYHILILSNIFVFSGHLRRRSSALRPPVWQRRTLYSAN